MCTAGLQCFRGECHVQGRLHGIITCDHGKLADLKTESVAWGPDIKKVLALCNDLVPLKKGQIVGRLEEKKAFADVEASFVVSHTESRGLCCTSNDESLPATQWLAHMLTDNDSAMTFRNTANRACVVMACRGMLFQPPHQCVVTPVLVF